MVKSAFKKDDRHELMELQVKLEDMTREQYLDFWLETHGGRSRSDLLGPKDHEYVVMVDGNGLEVKIEIEPKKWFLAPLEERIEVEKKLSTSVDKSYQQLKKKKTR